MLDYYEILKITPDASQEEIRKAFRKSAKASHPDLFPNDTPIEKEKRQIRFVQLTQAYEILSDHNHRRQYDQRRLSQTSETFTTKNQNQRTNTSSSFQKKASHVKRPSRGQDSYQEPEEALRELLRDVDNLLKKFGQGVQDPLEMLINWANNVFINTFKDEENVMDNQKDSSSSLHKKNYEKSSSQEYSNDMWQGLEEEFEKITKIKKSTDMNKTHSENEREIERELKILKKKYR